MSNKNWVVVLDSEGSPDPDKLIFLGELDRGIRQGVSLVQNAVRFTLAGAKRVAKTYSKARIAELDDRRGLASAPFSP